MDKDAFFTTPHRRLNLLTGEWVLVSPQRTARPWQGIIGAPPGETGVGHTKLIVSEPRLGCHPA